MAKALSNDLREWLIEGIDRDCPAARRRNGLGVSASRAIRWLDRRTKQGNVAANRQGGDRKSGRIEAEAAFSSIRNPRSR